MNNEQTEGTRDGLGGIGSGGDSGPGRDEGERGGQDGGQDDFCSDPTSDSTERTAVKRSSSGVPIRVCGNVGNTDGGGSTSRIRELPEAFLQGSENLEQRYFKGFKERCDRVFRELQKSNGQLVRDIFRFENDKEYQDLLRCVQNDEHYRRGLLQICREDTHVHVTHDCSYTNGTCRCNWFQKAKTYGLHNRRDKRGTRRNSCRSRTITDVQDILLYYCTKGRTLVLQKIGGKVERLPLQGYHLPQEGPAGLREALEQMGVEVERIRAKLQCGGSDIEYDEPTGEDDRQRSRIKRRRVGKEEKIQLHIVQLLELNPICPPEAICKHKLWRTDETYPELRFKSTADRLVSVAIKSFSDSLTVYTMEDYQTLYNHPECRPIFGAGYCEVDKYYYNVENSVKVLVKLVEYQFYDDPEQINKFVTTLYDVLERKQPKLNTIVVVSAANAGKNYFFDCIKDYYINTGHICSANKFNIFAFSGAAGRRLLHWNEPNYSPEYTDQIKEILGGDSTTVNVKYQSDTPVYRTPVIVTSNVVPDFVTNETFGERLRHFQWEPADWLAEYTKKPHPLAVYHFFKYYGLVK